MIERQRALDRPRRRPVELKHDRREQLHPVGDELAMIRLAQLAGIGIEPEAARAITRHA
jgi:hypothetical protein